MEIFTKEQVKEIIYAVYDYYWIQNTTKFWEWFEKRLNNKWLNGNNLDYEDKLEEFNEEEIESFIY